MERGGEGEGKIGRWTVGGIKSNLASDYHNYGE